MTHTVLHHLARHPVRALLATGGALLAVMAGGDGVRDWSGLLLFEARAQALVRIQDGPSRMVGWAFSYRGRRIDVRVPVPERQIAAARELPSEPVFMSGGALREAYMSTLVRTQSEGAVVGAVASELRGWRNRLALDDDAYLELIAHAVQEIPYGTPRPRVAPPAAFLADGSGVCSERSVLLAALLLHEGYDTAVWIFDSQRHVAVGVRGAGSGFEHSGYALIETTRESYVGEVGDNLAGRSAVIRAPQLVRVGGTRIYRADIEAQFIVDTMARTRSTRNALAVYRRYAETAVGPRQREFAAFARECDQTTRLAAWLETASDDRARVFRLLTDTGGR